MRKELTDKIMMCLMSRGINDSEISQEIIVILGDYEITERETAISIRTEDKNNFFLQKFLIAKTVKGCSERTVKLYKTELTRILTKIDKPADEITADDIRLYIALRQKRDRVTKATAGNEQRYLRSFFSFLHTEELIKRNPMAKVESIKKSRIKKEAFTEIEVEKIRSKCGNSLETAIVEVLLSTGCRVTELINIKINDINNDELIVHGKGDKDRTVYLNAKALIAIEKYLNERKDSNQYLFPGGFFANPQKDCLNWYKYADRVDPVRHMDARSVEGRIRKIGKKAGTRAHPHKFRRTCATFALRRGMPIEQVSKMLGHEQISTTQIYLDLSEEDLKNAHKKYVV